MLSVWIVTFLFGIILVRLHNPGASIRTMVLVAAAASGLSTFVAWSALESWPL